MNEQEYGWLMLRQDEKPLPDDQMKCADGSWINYQPVHGESEYGRRRLIQPGTGPNGEQMRIVGAKEVPPQDPEMTFDGINWVRRFLNNESDKASTAEYWAKTTGLLAIRTPLGRRGSEFARITR
jgi:hypothetical protein